MEESRPVVQRGMLKANVNNKRLTVQREWSKTVIQSPVESLLTWLLSVCCLRS